MNVISWNYRGLGNQRAVNVLSHVVREKRPKIIFLMETKQTVEEMRKVKEDISCDRLGRKTGRFSDVLEGQG